MASTALWTRRKARDDVEVELSGAELSVELPYVDVLGDPIEDRDDIHGHRRKQIGANRGSNHPDY